MEEKLIRAAQTLPTPTAGFEGIVAKSRNQAPPKKNYSRLRPVLIALAAALLLAGCATAYGAYKVSRGTWNLWGSNTWVDAKLEMQKYGIGLPEEFDGNDFREMSVSSSVPHGISYVQAIFSGYKSVGVYYGAEDLCYSVSVGSTQDDYWVTYYGYDSEELWSGDGDYLAVEYKGYTIHTGFYLSQNGDKEYKKATWVDPVREICVSVTGFDSRDPLPLAKIIIDGMK